MRARDPSASAASRATARLRRSLEACERWLAAGCAGLNAVETDGLPDGACSFNAAGPPAAESNIWDAGPGMLGMISRSLRFGRLLWCLASRQPSGAVALEFFAGGGGATALLAHGLAAGPADFELYSFERDELMHRHAFRILREQGLRVGAFPAGAVSSRLGERGEDRKSGAWLLLGEPLPTGQLPPEQDAAETAPLQALCRALGPVDVVVLDPPYEFRAEWPVLEEHCAPTFVAIHNSNLAGHAGWVRSHLLAKGIWREALNGSHLPAAIWNDPTHGSRPREWSLLWRPDKERRARAGDEPGREGGGGSAHTPARGAELPKLAS